MFLFFSEVTYPKPLVNWKTRSAESGIVRVRRAGMVIGIGKVCDVHQHPCVVVPTNLPTDDVLDLDVVWWLTKFFCKLVTASVA